MVNIGLIILKILTTKDIVWIRVNHFNNMPDFLVAMPKKYTSGFDYNSLI